jgi:hypothetical protein
MNTLTLITSTVMLLTSTGALANKFVAADNTAQTQLCLAIASNHQLTIYKTIRQFNTRKTLLSKKLECNDMSVAEFASKYNLLNSANFLNLNTTSTHIKDLSAATEDTTALITISGSK